MDTLRETIIDNIRSVSSLAEHPTHYIRVDHVNSCIPSIRHESRILTSFCRMMSGDSRYTTITAIEKTLSFLMTDISMPNTFCIIVTQLSVSFEKGLNNLRMLYEKDMTVSVTIDRILCTWNYIIQDMNKTN